MNFKPILQLSLLKQVDIIRMLEERGANLGLVDNQGDSGIIWAARQGHSDVIKHFVAQGVHLNQQNKVKS